MSQGIERSLEEVIALVQTLSPYLRNGSSLKVACLVTKIPYTSVLNYMVKYPDVCTIIESNIFYLDTVAESNIAYKIVNDKDVSTSKWWLERSQKEKYSSNNKLLEIGNDSASTKYKVSTDDSSVNKWDLSSLTDEELDTLERITSKLEHS